MPRLRAVALLGAAVGALALAVLGAAAIALAFAADAAIVGILGFAAGSAVATLWSGRIIAAAAGLAARFAAGESDLRLDPAVGPRPFRRFAAILNGIADAIAEREMRLNLVAEATGDAIWDWDIAAGTHSWSGSPAAQFGEAPPLQAKDPSWWLDRLHPDDRAEVLASALAARASSERLWSAEYRFRHADGGYRWFWDRCVIVRDADGEAVRVIGCMSDVTAARQARDDNWRLANLDALTGLPNRFNFQGELDKAFALGAEAGTTFALLLVDVDHFKDVNDTLGHDAGDALLAELGKRLKVVVGRRGVVARIGGDEFAVLTEPGGAGAGAEALAQDILQALRPPTAFRGQSIRARATIGIARAPDHAGAAVDLLKNADLALYHGKAGGRSRFLVFDPEMRAEYERRTRVCALVEANLRRDAFFPYYQPKISLVTGEVRGFEALLRWRRADGSIHTPGMMLPAFDKPDLACELGERMWSRVLADTCRWRREGVAFDHVAINVSAAECRSPSYAERILTGLAAADLPPSCLTVEVTETVLLGRDADVLGPLLEQLHRAGVRIALDDFGTGYAALTHLRQYPVDEIKIDQSFVRSLHSDSGSQAIVATILGLGQRLGKTVVAEGVETLEQAMLLRASGCVQVQGFLFARPMPAADVPGYLATARRVDGTEPRLRMAGA